MLIVVIVVYIQASQLEGYITIVCIAVWTAITWWQHKNRDKIFEQRVLKFKEDQKKQQTKRELYIQQLEKNIQDLQLQIAGMDEVIAQKANDKFRERWQEQEKTSMSSVKRLREEVQNLKLQSELMYEFEKSLSDIVDRMSGEVYERYVGYKLTKMGWKNMEYTAVTKDYGADIIAEDSKGKTICIQCKRYSDPVGISAVQEVFAAQGYYGCNGAMAVTTSTFTKAAHELAERNSVKLLENFR